MNNIEFYKVKDAECDFCGRKKKVVTQSNQTYVCAKCAKEIYVHAKMNEAVVKRESRLAKEYGVEVE